MTRIKPFINKYKCEGINFLLEKDDKKKFEKNNITISLNVLYAKKENIHPAYFSKHNSNRVKQVILLMILNGEKLSALLRGITSWWFLLSKLPSFFCNRKKKLEPHKKICEKMIFVMLLQTFEDTKILEFNQYQKSYKAPFIIYLECIIEKIDGYKIILKIHLQQK